MVSKNVKTYDYYSPQQVEQFIAEAIRLERKRVAYKKRINRRMNMAAFLGMLLVLLVFIGFFAYYFGFGYLL